MCRARAFTLLAILIVVLQGCSVSASEAPRQKMDLALQSIAGDSGPLVQLPVIVQARAPDFDEYAALGGVVKCSFESIAGFAGTIPSDRLSELAALPWVDRISHDGGVRKMLDSAAPAVGADFAWDYMGLTGKGVTVAVIDSGISDHADYTGLLPNNTPLGSRIIGVRDWCSNTSDPAFMGEDVCGHGSNVSGIVAGNGIMSTNVDPENPEYLRTYRGVAPEACLVNCRVLNEDGNGFVSDVVSAIEWCVSKRNQLNIRVINLSLGRPVGESYVTDPLCQACEYAWSKGIVVVTSAGNAGYEGYSTILSPGNDPYVITVGAINDKGTATLSDDEVCAYSSRGPSPIDHVLKPDLVAPGNRVSSTRHRNSQLERLYGSTNVVPPPYYIVDPEPVKGKGKGKKTKHYVKDSEYFVLSGTSMSAAIVSGACALMIEADPSLDPDTIKTRLMLTAEKSPVYGALWQGAGYVSIPDAIECPVYSATPAKSPSVVECDAGAAIAPVPQLVDGTNLVWEPQVPPGGGKKAAYMWPVFSIGGFVDGGNLVWEPVVPPANPNAYVVFVPDQPIYPPDPGSECYQPGLDPQWGDYAPLHGWPQNKCVADVSDVVVNGEDFAEYYGNHGGANTGGSSTGDGDQGGKGKGKGKGKKK